MALGLNIEDVAWRSVYLQLPKHDGARCVVRTKGRGGYATDVIWDYQSRTFRTTSDVGNRIIIIIWKCDEWQYMSDFVMQTGEQ